MLGIDHAHPHRKHEHRGGQRPPDEFYCCAEKAVWHGPVVHCAHFLVHMDYDHVEMANTFTTSSSSCRPVFILPFTSSDPVVRHVSVVSGQTFNDPVYGIADAFYSLLGDRLGETGIKFRHFLELVIREIAVLRGLMDSLELLLH